MQRKSQSALEFLTTYGWAFLVIIIMIGTLAYFGILSPSKILPNRCTFGAEFQCLDHQIGTSSFKMRLKNNVGEAIKITGLTYATETGGFFCATTAPSTLVRPDGTGDTWNSGSVISVELSGGGCVPPGLAAGEKGKILLTIEYFPISSGASYKKQAKGEVFSTVI